MNSIYFYFILFLGKITEALKPLYIKITENTRCIVKSLSGLLEPTPKNKLTNYTIIIGYMEHNPKLEAIKHIGNNI